MAIFSHQAAFLVANYQIEISLGLDWECLQRKCLDKMRMRKDDQAR